MFLTNGNLSAVARKLNDRHERWKSGCLPWFFHRSWPNFNVRGERRTVLVVVVFSIVFRLGRWNFGTVIPIRYITYDCLFFEYYFCIELPILYIGYDWLLFDLKFCIEHSILHKMYECFCCSSLASVSIFFHVWLLFVHVTEHNTCYVWLFVVPI